MEPWSGSRGESPPERGVAQVLRASPTANPVGVMRPRRFPTCRQPICRPVRAFAARRAASLAPRSLRGAGAAAAARRRGVAHAPRRRDGRGDGRQAGGPTSHARSSSALGITADGVFGPQTRRAVQALPARARPRRSTASPAPQTLARARPVAVAASALDPRSARRRRRAARADRAVRVGRRPDRGLGRRPLPRQVPVLARDLARRSAARGDPAQAPEAVQDRLRGQAATRRARHRRPGRSAPEAIAVQHAPLSDQRSVSGASRIRSTRAGAPATTALAGTSLVTTEFVPIDAVVADRDAAQDAGAVADPAVVADVHVALVDPLQPDRALDLDDAVVEVDQHHAVGDDALAPDRDVLEGGDRALLARARSSRRSRPRPRGRGSSCRGRSRTSGRAAAWRRGRSRASRPGRRSTARRSAAARASAASATPSAARAGAYFDVEHPVGAREAQQRERAAVRAASARPRTQRPPRVAR